MDPAVRAEFNRTYQGVRDKKDKQEPRAGCPATEMAQHAPDAHAHSNRDVEPLVASKKFTPRHALQQFPETVLDEQADEEADHGSADDPHVIQHVAKLQTLLGSLGLGEVLA